MEREEAMQVSPILVPIVLFVCLAASAIGIPIARAYARRIEREPREPVMPPDLQSRLERMEQALDSIAIEVERISEGQRFTTKLLAEKPKGENLPERAP
jgi:hypothetical protein